MICIQLQQNSIIGCPSQKFTFYMRHLLSSYCLRRQLSLKKSLKYKNLLKMLSANYLSSLFKWCLVKNKITRKQQVIKKVREWIFVKTDGVQFAPLLLFLQSKELYERGMIFFLLQMKATDIQIELRNYKIRQGYLYKRSRIMRQWRKRWIVLTMNFLFSFESQKCEKPTEIIDLKQVISLRTMFKLHEDIFTNCFFIQTKSTDFAIATREIVQKWSWIVTFQRLFDFKERGASDHNSIDHIKKEGFQSQQEFEYQRLYKAKNELKMSKTKSFEQECKKKQEKANQILQQLIQQQEKLNSKEQQLLFLENSLQREKIALNQAKKILQVELNLKLQDPKNSREQPNKQTIQQEVECNSSSSQIKLLAEYIDLVSWLIQLDIPNIRQKLTSKLQCIAQLSLDSQYRKLCSQTLLSLKN